MRKLNLVIIILLLLNLIFYFIKTTNIKLPKGAHHNTFGQLPITQIIDSKDYYEKDIDRDNAREDKIYLLQEKIRSQYMQCLKNSKYSCGYNNLCKKKKYSNCEKKYDALMKRSFTEYYPYTAFISFYDEDYEDGWVKGYLNNFRKGYTLK